MDNQETSWWNKSLPEIKVDNQETSWWNKSLPEIPIGWHFEDKKESFIGILEPGEADRKKI